MKHAGLIQARQTSAAPFALSLLICALVQLTSCAGPNHTALPAQGDGAQSPPAVATVDGRVIPSKLYEMYFRNGREELGLSEADEDGRRKLDLLREGIVSELIDGALIAGEAERRGLGVTPEQFAEAERAEVSKLGGERKFAQYLSAHRLTREEFGEVVRGRLYSELLGAELTKEVVVTDAEVEAFYAEHRADPEFRRPERVRASHILIASRPGESGRGGDLRRRAEELKRKAARRGADFAALAREFSEDEGTRASGGDLGFFTRGTHTPAFDEAAFQLRPGAVGPVVESDYGLHVIKVEAREPARTLTPEEAAPAIRRRLHAERRAATLRAWLQDARRRARIRVEEPFRIGALRDEFPGG